MAFKGYAGGEKSGIGHGDSLSENKSAGKKWHGFSLPENKLPVGAIAAIRPRRPASRQPTLLGGRKKNIYARAERSGVHFTLAYMFFFALAERVGGWCAECESVDFAGCEHGAEPGAAR